VDYNELLKELSSHEITSVGCYTIGETIGEVVLVVLFYNDLIVIIFFKRAPLAKSKKVTIN
jgi:hypothetical protein